MVSSGFLQEPHGVTTQKTPFFMSNFLPSKVERLTVKITEHEILTKVAIVNMSVLEKWGGAQKNSIVYIPFKYNIQNV
jgi:hypothetical protein